MDEQAKEYLEMKFSGKIKKGKIDDLIMSKRWKIILLNQIKSNCKNLDNTLITIAHSDI